MTIESRCSLPLEYPDVLPKVYVSCSAASRSQQKEFNDKLDEFVSSQPLGELCLSSILMWIQEKAPHLIKLGPQNETKSPIKRQKSKHTGISRLWIYSHHIYRKELLKKIPECAQELDLTGFCLPGKPGIICVEGYSDFCDEFWRKLRYPNWKHISCKHREDKPIASDTDAEEALRTFRLFSSFEELAFEAHGDYGLRNDYHMDLGQFRQYLEKHGCQQIFTILFGLDGKTASD